MNIAALSGDELLRRTLALVTGERRVGTKLIEHLLEIDRRRLYRNLGYNSLYEYCVAPSEGLPFNAIVDAVAPMFAADVPPPPPSPRLVRFAFTADEEFYNLLERVRALLERKDPGIRWEMIRRRR